MALERLNDAMVYGAMACLAMNDTLTLSSCCRHFRENAAMADCALRLMGCTSDWFDILPRKSHKSCRDEGGQSSAIVPTFSLVAVAYRMNCGLAPYCYRAFPSKDPAVEFSLRPLVIPIAFSGGAPRGAADVRKRLEEVVAAAFGGASGAATSAERSLHCDTSVVVESLEDVVPAFSAAAPVKAGHFEQGSHIMIG